MEVNVTMTESVTTAVVDGNILVVTINRPQALNAVDNAVATGLVHAREQLDGDSDLVVGVITGAGKHFSAGMDLKAFQNEGAPRDMMDFLTRRASKPMIAAVEGVALAGGLEIALTCDLMVASETSRFGIPEVSVGLFAAGGALCRLPRRVPVAVALEMALTGKPISAGDALTHGLVNRLAAPGQVLEAALDLARTITPNSPVAVEATRRLMHDSLELSEEDFWPAQAPVIEQVFASDDAREGARAFAEKRAPRWTGR